MGRHACGPKHDEVTKLVKPLLKLGLTVSRVVWDGKSVSVIIGDIEKTLDHGVDASQSDGSPKEVETL